MTIAAGQTAQASDILKHANDQGYLQLTDSSELTIASGAVTVTANFYRVDTEGDAASDDLDTITAGTGVSDGHPLILRAENSARTVVVKHNTGNILCANGVNQTLDDSHDALLLTYDGNLSKWFVFGFVGPLSINTGSIASDAVTTAKIADGNVTRAKLSDGLSVSVIGRAGGTDGVVADIQADDDHTVLRREGTTLSFGQVVTGAIADNNVTYAKLSATGASAGQLLQYNGSALAWVTQAGTTGLTFAGRQGGNATNYATAGTSNFAPASVKMFAGSRSVSGSASVSVTFPSAFSATPIVLVSNAVGNKTLWADTITATDFVINAGSNDFTAHWIAIGPP